MDTNDFLGSFAQENVSFTTQYAKTASVGDNFWKVMIFVENDRFVNTEGADWKEVAGVAGVKALAVNADNYLGYMNTMSDSGVNILQSWLSDLFVNGFTGDCILVGCGASTGVDSLTAFTTNMQAAYNALKAYAYHKTVCAAPTEEAAVMTAINASLAVSLAQYCATDKGLLSAAPYYPFTTSTPEDASSDAIYSALTSAQVDAFMAAYQDSSRNAALYSLGLALATINGSNTCVGNSMDMIASGNIQGSGASGANLSKAIRDELAKINIQTFKPVGDNTGSYAAIGAKTIQGDVVQATWILAYITYMTKVEVARIITTPNFLKNAANYSRIVTAMGNQISLFGKAGSGRLENIAISAPSFPALQQAEGDEIVIPNAWSATYVDQVRKVQITGTLYIGA